MKTIPLFLTVFLIMTGCASEKVLTPVESVQKTQDSVDKTNEFVTRAEKTLDDFEKNIQDIIKDASKSDKMRGKTKFNEALTGMDQRMVESRRDLARLKVANTESWETYKGELDSAKDNMHSSFNENSK